MKAKQLDKRFDAGKDVSAFLDLARAKRTNQQPRRVNVDRRDVVRGCPPGRVFLPR